MEWSWQSVMEEFVQGKEMANQLPEILRKGDVISAEGLVTKILESLTDTLLIMNVSSQECSNDVKEPREELISEALANGSSTSVVTDGGDGDGGVGDESSSWEMEDWNELNEESCKGTQVFRDRRGSYKRRKTSHSWTKETLDLLDDGHAWRKYGQKTILNTKHPRNYFRCTYKIDQGCKATKHTQKIKDEPQLFRTTYFGNHTCTDYLKAPEFILDCSSSLEDPSPKNMIRFDNFNHENTLNYNQERPFFSTFTYNKKESNKGEETMMQSIEGEDQATRYDRSLASSPYRVSPAVDVFEAPGGFFSDLSSMIINDHDYVNSRMIDEYLDNDFSYKLW